MAQITPSECCAGFATFVTQRAARCFTCARSWTLCVSGDDPELEKLRRWVVHGKLWARVTQCLSPSRQTNIYKRCIGGGALISHAASWAPDDVSLNIKQLVPILLPLWQLPYLIISPKQLRAQNQSCEKIWYYSLTKSTDKKGNKIRSTFLKIHVTDDTVCFLTCERNPLVFLQKMIRQWP